MERHNSFYSAFDTECVERRRRSDYRTSFQKDRDRILYTSAFRRLQAKTQVFMSGEYDFYRTRLTHSLEVAQIGRSICQFLRHDSDHLNDDFYIDSDLVEAVCLSHDLGHPPFGHAGERVLNQIMKRYGGFEGNAQTVRILTETIYSDSERRRGMNPTRALLDGVMKYKSLYHQYDNPVNHFLYDEQQAVLDFIFAGREVPGALTPGTALNRFRSIECQIMDWADDTAYSIHDIVDGINAGFLTVANIERWSGEQELTRLESDLLLNLLRRMRTQRVERSFAVEIGECIKSCRLEPRSTFMDDLTRRYAYDLKIDPDTMARTELYKRLSFDLVFQAPQIVQLEYKEHRLLKQLFSVYQEHYIDTDQPEMKLLPALYETLVARESNPVARARLICDHIAGMTDGFAIRTYRRFFDPNFGSIIDFV
jgi:dGTPase